MKSTICSFLILAIASIGYCSTSTNAMYVDGLSFQIGQNQQSVLDSIQGQFKYDEMNNTVILMNKNGPPYRVRGQLQFENMKLKSISRTLAESNDLQAFEELFRAISRRSQEQDNAAKVTVNQWAADDQSLTMETMSFQFRDRTIDISSSKSQDANVQSSVTVEECLGHCQQGIRTMK